MLFCVFLHKFTETFLTEPFVCSLLFSKYHVKSSRHVDGQFKKNVHCNGRCLYSIFQDIVVNSDVNKLSLQIRMHLVYIFYSVSIAGEISVNTKRNYLRNTNYLSSPHAILQYKCSDKNP